MEMTWDSVATLMYYSQGFLLWQNVYMLIIYYTLPDRKWQSHANVSWWPLGPSMQNIYRPHSVAKQGDNPDQSGVHIQGIAGPPDWIYTAYESGQLPCALLIHWSSTLKLQGPLTQCKKCAKEVHTSWSADEAEKKGILSVTLQVPFLTTWVIYWNNDFFPAWLIHKVY